VGHLGGRRLRRDQRASARSCRLARADLLNFYANDTYEAEGWEQGKLKWTFPAAACQNFVGHRFKQILIDGQVVWEQDVADAETFNYASVDVSRSVKPGKEFDLTLRVIDKVSPATRLPGDEFHLGIWDWQAQGDKDADKKFHTRVFWGDVALSEGASVAWRRTRRGARPRSIRSSRLLPSPP